MGEVFLAQTRGPGGFVREIALKVIRPEIAVTPRLAQMFMREGRLLAKLNHRGIVGVYDLGVADGRLYLAMEYLQGIDLGSLLLGQADNKTLSPAASLYVAKEVAHALSAAHSLRAVDAPAGIIHGDLSPTNIFVCRDGAVKLLDFGLARVSGLEPSSANLCGKLGYLAPESIARVPLDHRADLFSLGVVLYECLVGERLFSGGTAVERLNAVLQQEIPAPSVKAPGISPAVDEIVAKALCRDRMARWQTADELARVLEGELRGSFGASELAAAIAPMIERLHSVSPAGEPIALASLPPAPRSVPPRARRLFRAWLVLLVLAVVGLAAVATLLVQSVRPRDPSREISPVTPAPPRPRAPAVAEPSSGTPAVPFGGRGRPRAKAASPTRHRSRRRRPRRREVRRARVRRSATRRRAPASAAAPSPRGQAPPGAIAPGTLADPYAASREQDRRRGR